MSRLYDQVLALAGMFQAARLTQQLARDGRAEPDALAAALESILRLEAPNTESIFGGARGVTLGLKLLRDKLAGQTDPRDLEMARYVMAMLQLESRLRRDAATQDAIGRGVETVQTQMKFFAATQGEDARQQTLVDKLAELYTQTLSNLPPRIMVNGEHGHLANPITAARVRVALFAGVRAAFLWRQLGGRRWQLLLSRRKIANEAAHILDALRQH